MSEQTNTEIDYAAPIGQPSPGGDYREMVPGNPMPKEDLPDEVFGSDQTGIEQAANEVAQRREETREERQAKKPLQREYQQQAGEHRGEPSPVHEILSPEQAAFELNEVRRSERALEADEAARQTIADLDAQANLDQAQADVAQPQPEEQPQQQPAAEQPRFAHWYEDPEGLSTVSQWAEQRDAQQLSSLADNARTTLAGTFSQFPELHSITNLNQIEPVINAVAQSNPQRAQAMAETTRATAQALEHSNAVNLRGPARGVGQIPEGLDQVCQGTGRPFCSGGPGISR